jgi:hypothetical protein
VSFAQLYGWLILDFFIYLLIGLYLDNVLASTDCSCYSLTKS